MSVTSSLWLRRQNRSAFTLIELLVVIAIIALLAAILFPVFTQAREKARQASCMGNIKNVGTAMLLYVQDYDEMVMPFCVSYTPASGGTITSYWYEQYNSQTKTVDKTKSLLFPYTRNIPIMECPSALDISNSIMVADATGIGYGYNGMINNVTTTDTDASGGTARVNGFLPMSSITQPSDTLLIADSAFPTSSASGGVSRYTYLFPPYTYIPASKTYIEGSIYLSGFVHGRHNGVSNVIWLDGHVKAMPVQNPPTSLFSGDYSVAYQNAHHIGFVVKGSLPEDAATADYYYVYNK